MVALYLILMGAYIFSYSGLPQSPDEYIIFDSTQSLVLHGTMARTIGFNVDPTIQKDGTPWPQQKYEPLQIIIAAPLFWLAHQLPNIGQLHTVFTLNIFVTTLTALSLYLIALRRGYSLGVAWSGALIFGLATAAWPYSRWIFREPIMGFFVLWAFHFATQIPKRIEQQQSVWRQGLFAAVMIVGAIFAKQVGWLILPAIVLSFLPTHITWRRALPAILILIVIFVGFILLVLFLQPNVEEGRYSFEHWTDPQNFTWASIPESFLGYQVSPARSLWLFSPVLIAGWIGTVMLFKQGDWRMVVGPAFAIVLVSASYGATRQSTVWNGGWGWGPRYMVPFLPLLMLWVLPVLAWLFRKPVTLKHQLAWLAFIPLLIVSVGMQWLGLGVPYTNYYTKLQFNLFDNPARFGEWQKWADYNWVWSQSQIPYHWHHFNGEQLQPAWTVVDSTWVVPLLTLLMVFTGLALSYHALFVSQDLPRLHPILKTSLIPIVVLLPLASMSIGIYQLCDDERYIAGQEDVFDLIKILNREVKADDIVFIERGEYSRLFMNYFKADALLMTLPQPLRGGYAPGEPEIRDDELYAAVGPYIGYALAWATQHYAHLWYVAGSGPSISNAIRPAERLLAVRYFPVKEYTVSPVARAILYDTVDTPATPPVYSSGLVFGDQLVLVGFDLPIGTSFKAGQIVPISLIWSPLQPLPTNYYVRVQLSDSHHSPVANHAGLPIATFGFMSRWQAGQIYRDNHGLLLPANLPQGEYQLEVAVYDSANQQRLFIRNATGEGLGDVAILIPLVIQ